MDKRIFAALLSIALLSGCAADEGIPAQSAESTPAATLELQSAAPAESTADSVSVEVLSGRFPGACADHGGIRRAYPGACSGHGGICRSCLDRIRAAA